MRDAMREHVGLARAGAGDDEQRLRAVRIADAMLHREPLRVVEVGQGRGANRGEHGGRKQGLRFVRKGGEARDGWASRAPSLRCEHSSAKADLSYPRKRVSSRRDAAVL